MFVHREASFTAICLHRRQVCVRGIKGSTRGPHCWNTRIVSSVGILNTGDSTSDPSFDVSMHGGAPSTIVSSRLPDGMTSDFQLVYHFQYVVPTYPFLSYRIYEQSGRQSRVTTAKYKHMLLDWGLMSNDRIIERVRSILVINLVALLNNGTLSALMRDHIGKDSLLVLWSGPISV